MRHHQEALFTADGAGRLLRANDEGRGPAPRFFLGCTGGGNVWSVGRDVGEGLARALGALAEAEPARLDVTADPERYAPFLTLLMETEPVQRTWMGPTYRFPEAVRDGGRAVAVTRENASVLRPHLEGWLTDVAESVPIAADLHRGCAVSICCSVRVTAHVHEAGVETHADFRRRGHALRAVNAWAKAVRSAGRTPLYSTAWENEPSRALAARADLVQYGSTFHAR